MDSAFGRDQTRKVVLSALGYGINFFETSDSYGDGSREECLRIAPHDHRDEAIVAIKYGSPPESVSDHCRAGPSRLKM